MPTEPFLSQISVFAFDWAPKNWALCHGQMLPINQNQALFALLGTTYGGDGQTVFGLPDLRGRVPIGTDWSQYSLGQWGGENAHVLTLAELPQHTHQLLASPNPGTATAAGSGDVLASAHNTYAAPATPVTVLHTTSVQHTGGSQAHTNLMPSMALNFCIALQGVFPSPN